MWRNQGGVDGRKRSEEVFSTTRQLNRPMVEEVLEVLRRVSIVELMEVFIGELRVAFIEGDLWTRSL